MTERDWLNTGRPTMRSILRHVAEETGVSAAELIGQGRKASIVRARQYAMYRMRQETRQSLPQIGAFLGGRDHTTVLHGVRAHAKRMAEAELRCAA